MSIMVDYVLGVTVKKSCMATMGHLSISSFLFFCCRCCCCEEGGTGERGGVQSAIVLKTPTLKKKCFVKFICLKMLGFFKGRRGGGGCCKAVLISWHVLLTAVTVTSVVFTNSDLFLLNSFGFEMSLEHVPSQTSVLLQIDQWTLYFQQNSEW